MRVPDSLHLATIQRNMSGIQSRLLQASREASSGSRIQNPSDDPVAAAQFIRIQQGLDTTESSRSAITVVRGDVAMAESSLASASDMMVRAQEIALQGANGTTSTQGRQALAEEVRQIMDQMISIGNQKGAQGYLFGGTATQSPPFSSSGVFSGNDLARVVQIGPRESMTISASGAQAFTVAGGRDVLADLGALQAALLADNSTAVAGTIDSMESGRRQIFGAQADAGLKMNRLDIAQAALEQAGLSLGTQRHDVADADQAGAATRLMSANSSLQAAISVSQTVLSALGKGRFS